MHCTTGSHTQYDLAAMTDAHYVNDPSLTQALQRSEFAFTAGVVALQHVQTALY